MTKHYAIFVALLTFGVVALSAVFMQSPGALLPLLTLPAAAWLAYVSKPSFFKLGHSHVWGAFLLVVGGAALAGLGLAFKVELLWAVGIAAVLIQPFASCAAPARLRHR